MNFCSSLERCILKELPVIFLRFVRLDNETICAHLRVNGQQVKLFCSSHTIHHVGYAI